MKKLKLVMSIATMCLAIAVLCFGVLSATQIDYTISGEISYEVTDAFVEVQTKIYTSSKYLKENEIAAVVERAADTDFGSTPTGLTYLQGSGVFSSLNGDNSGGYLDITSLKFHTGENPVYAYFFVVNVKNLSSAVNVWAVISDDLTSPDNTCQVNNGLQQNIAKTDTNGKNIVIGVGLKDVTSPINNEQQAFSYGVKIGSGVLADQQFNLDKFSFSGNSVTPSNNAKGVLVVPETYNGVDISQASYLCAYNSSATNYVTHIVYNKNFLSAGSYGTLNSSSNVTKIIFPNGISNSASFSGITNMSGTNYTVSKLYTLELGDTITDSTLIDKLFGTIGVNLSTVKLDSGNTVYSSLDKNGNNSNLMYSGDTLIFAGYDFNIDNIPNTVTKCRTNVLSKFNSGVLNIPAQITSINETKGCNSVIFDDSVTTLGDITLENVRSVNLNNVTQVGTLSLKNCDNINVSLLQSITGALTVNCPNMLSLNLSQLTSVAGALTINCSNLTSLDFLQLTSITGDATITCPQLTNLDLSQLQSMKKILMAGCSNLEQFILNSSCTCTLTAQQYTWQSAVDFQNCTNLKIVYLPINVFKDRVNGDTQTQYTTIGTFGNCSSLEEIVFLGDVAMWKSAYSGYDKFPASVRKITFNSTTVPTDTNFTKSYLPTTATIYVPNSALSAYTTWLGESYTVVGF